MRRLIWILLVVLAVSPVFAVEIATIDYKLTDVVVKPISYGVCSWTDDEGTRAAPYISVCCMTHWDIRLEMGMAFAYIDKVEVRALTGLSYAVSENYLVGAWYSPFWGYDDRDDPWGVMVGRRF